VCVTAIVQARVFTNTQTVHDYGLLKRNAVLLVSEKVATSFFWVEVKEAGSSKTIVLIYQTIRRRIPGDAHTLELLTHTNSTLFFTFRTQNNETSCLCGFSHGQGIARR
jgi:hypothetical protein